MAEVAAGDHRLRILTETYRKTVHLSIYEDARSPRRIRSCPNVPICFPVLHKLCTCPVFALIITLTGTDPLIVDHELIPTCMASLVIVSLSLLQVKRFASDGKVFRMSTRDTCLIRSEIAVQLIARRLPWEILTTYSIVAVIEMIALRPEFVCGADTLPAQDVASQTQM